MHVTPLTDWGSASGIGAMKRSLYRAGVKAAVLFTTYQWGKPQLSRLVGRECGGGKDSPVDKS